MYECAYTGGAQKDTIDADSIDTYKEILLDENGNPIEADPTMPTDGNATEPRQHNTEKEVNFDDL